MAEALAAFYAVETAVEGAAVGAYVASKPTAPLHIRFRKLKSAGPWTSAGTYNGSLGHSFNIVKGKGYVFGGDLVDAEPDSRIRVLTLPSSLEIGSDADLQIIEPEPARERPLEAYSDKPVSSTDTGNTNHVPEPRADHSAVSIDSNIFVLGGRAARRLEKNESSAAGDQGNGNIFPNDIIHCFSTQMATWTTIKVNMAACQNGIPAPRIQASCASTSDPKPDSGIEITTTAHGTIFLHGGYDSQGQALRDFWSFDVSSRIWTRWPDIPDPSPEEVAGEGRIVCQNGIICRVGDGFGKVNYMEFDTSHTQASDTKSEPTHTTTTSLNPKIQPKSQQWTTISFIQATQDQPLSLTETLPVPRKSAAFLPITTGSGRLYNLYLMGQDGPTSTLNDTWALQTKSQDTSGASIKDKLRSVVGKPTGENSWSLCQVIQSTKDDGPLDLPPSKGLTGFAADIWTDMGGANVVLWGGRSSDNVFENGGWVISVE